MDLTRPVEPSLIRECLELALQAPNGSNIQGWHFVVVTDPAKRAALADLYRRGGVAYASSKVAVEMLACGLRLELAQHGAE